MNSKLLDLSVLPNVAEEEVDAMVAALEGCAPAEEWIEPFGASDKGPKPSPSR
jgi:hypothetical protein